jgi:hypothetical protein
MCSDPQGNATIPISSIPGAEWDSAELGARHGKALPGEGGEVRGGEERASEAQQVPKAGTRGGDVVSEKDDQIAFPHRSLSIARHRRKPRKPGGPLRRLAERSDRKRSIHEDIALH